MEKLSTGKFPRIHGELLKLGINISQERAGFGRMD
jgi:hypothetical protein